MRRPILLPLRSAFVLSALLAAASLNVQAESQKPEPQVAIAGRVVDEQGNPVAAVAVRGFAYTDMPEAKTDDEGRFTLNVTESRVRQLIAVAEDVEHDRMGRYQNSWENPPTAETPIEIKLAPSRRFDVAVTDAAGQPAGGATVGAIVDYAPLATATTDESGKAVLRAPSDGELQMLYAVAEDEGFDYRVVKTARDDAHQANWLVDSPIRFQLAAAQTVRIQLVDREERPVRDASLSLWLLNKPGEPDSFNLSYTPTLFRVRTDEAGVAEFRGVPNWRVHPLTFWPTAETYVHQRISFDPEEHPEGELTVTLERLAPVSGQVKLADGRPAEGVDVLAAGAGYEMDGHRSTGKTGADGRFTLGVVPNQLYMFLARQDRLASAAVDGIVVKPDEPVDGLEFQLAAATRVYGRVIIGEEEKPVAGQRISLTQQGRDLHHLEGVELPNPEKSRLWIQPNMYLGGVTDEDGRFEFFVGPGKFSISGPSQAKAQQFEVTTESELEFKFHVPRPESGPFAGMVVAGDPPRPVAGAVVEGKYRTFSAGRDLRLRTDENGRFSGERALHRTVLYAKGPEGDSAGIVEIEPDQEEVTVSIAPLASVKGRLVDANTRQPLAETPVQWGRRVHKGDDEAPWETAWGGTAATDADGFFELSGLVVGQRYELSVPRGDGTYGSLPDVTPTAAKVMELGDLELKPPYKPPTLEERIDRELAFDKPAMERYEHALEEAQRLRQHVLVVFVDRVAPFSEEWFKLRLEDDAVRSALPDYQLITLDVEADGAADLAERLGANIDFQDLPTWYFGDASGEKLATGSIPRSKETPLDRVSIVELLGRHAPQPLDARELLQDALAEAASSNRRVIVQETATWCGPCHMLSRFLEKHRAIWEKDYLWVRIDQRWHGSEEVMNGIREGDHGGIPWFAILDGEGDVMATSDGSEGNIGYPSEPASIDHFMTMLESTKQRLSEDELVTLREDLESR